MRTPLTMVLTAVLASSVAHAETIIIEEKITPPVLPKQKKQYQRIAPPYSDYAIEHDVWALAWLLVEVDPNGAVSRVKLIKKPGADLDQIAIDRAFSMQFEPARDLRDNPTSAYLLVPIEWPSYGWMIMLEGLATRIPPSIDRVKCKGTGPLNLSSMHPVLRDCTPPDVAAAAKLEWIERPKP